MERTDKSNILPQQISVLHDVEFDQSFVMYIHHFFFFQLVMYNVGANTDYEDVERFFAGFDYDPSHVRFIKVYVVIYLLTKLIFDCHKTSLIQTLALLLCRSNEQAQNRGAQRRPISYHVAVGFTTKLEALRALREKSGDFCGNMSVNLRLIQ